MAASQLVVDTTIFIEFLRANDKSKTILFSIPEETNLFLSSVTLYELHMGATTIEKQRDIKKLVENLTVLPFNEEVAEHAGTIYHELRKSNQIIEFRDIFIAATCIAYSFPLKTINIKHFSRIRGLRLL